MAEHEYLWIPPYYHGKKSNIFLPLPAPQALSGAEEMRMGRVSLLPSWTTVSANKWPERATQRMGQGTTGECLDGGPTFVSHQKERDVHTKTSTAVLFIKGATLKTTSKCPAAGKGGTDYSELLGGVSPGVGEQRGGLGPHHQMRVCPQLRPWGQRPRSSCGLLSTSLFSARSLTHAPIPQTLTENWPVPGLEDQSYLPVP